MPLEGKTLKVCSCNRTMALDAKALAAALQSGAPLTIHTELCRREVGRSARRIAAGGECIVACTQEAPLFTELNESAGGKSELKFVNIRELGGLVGRRRESHAEDRCAARAGRCYPTPSRCPASPYKSKGSVLVIGPAEAALRWAERLVGRARGERADHHTRAARSCRSSGAIRSGPAQVARDPGLARRVRGRVGADEPDRPRCLHTVQRLHSRLSGERDRLHLPGRSRRSARGTASASRPAGRCRRSTSIARDRARRDRFDLVLDLSRRADPEGCRRSRRAISRPAAIRSSRRSRPPPLAKLVGEFEKPKFFIYDERICAHGRSGKIGCTKCIDVCSTRSRSRSDGRQGEGRAAPVRGLRRLRDGMPVGRDDLRESAGVRDWARA